MLMVRCNLDDFIANNHFPVLVEDYSKPVIFPGINYVALPGAEYHLEVLRGQGFGLEANVCKGTDLTKGIGLAYILKNGLPTGFVIRSKGTADSNGTWTHKYFIEDEDLLVQGYLCGDWDERSRRAQNLQKLKQCRLSIL